ncbi:MAG: tRNA (adenosine(37)-N6)-dimethylallyltransferase MiaA [Dehalococcoidales bacterium]|nr:tRNA (adenosine(37)-N6)-dimethylallyltransferase MiaA [Dehalococcoidales bacterium]
MNKVLAIVGPTGVGKTRLAIQLARRFNGEIINADSRQIYCYMNIGTAKPSQKELSLVPHHLFDIIEPDREFSLAEYQHLAFGAIEAIQMHNNKLPLLVGGSGLYVWAVLEGWVVPAVPPDIEFRKGLEQKAANGGAEELYQELKSLDPAAAEKIDPRNVRRVIRALEVSKSALVPFSKLQQKKPPKFQSLIIGLTAERKELYRRVDERVDEMVEHGFVEEVRKLLDKGYNLRLPSMFSIGYREIGQYLQGEMTLDEAVYKIKVGTHRFVRHQYAWFRLDDDRIKWFDVTDIDEVAVEKAVAEFLEK